MDLLVLPIQSYVHGTELSPAGKAAPTARGIQRAGHQLWGTPQKESLLINQEMRILWPFPPPPPWCQALAALGTCHISML